MNIRATTLHPWHIPQLLGTFVFANAQQQAVVRYPGRLAPALVAAAATTLGFGSRYRAVAAWGDGSLVGFGVTRRPLDTRQSVIEALTVINHPNVDGKTPGMLGDPDSTVCGELLRGLTAVDAVRGSVGVIARVPVESPFCGTFTSNGFGEVMRERVFHRPPAPAPEPPDILGLRPQERADAWDLQQLHRAITPAAAQQADSPNLHMVRPLVSRWRLGRGGARESYVVASERGLAAWIEIERDIGQTHRMNLMTHPRSADLVASVIEFGLWRLSQWNTRPVQTVVRDHEWQVAARLQASGFVNTHTRVLMVKHMAVRIAAKAPPAALGRVTS